MLSHVAARNPGSFYDTYLVPAVVAKMASHAIFQNNILAIDDTHNTWTNMIVKMIILRLLGSSDDKEKKKIGVASPEGPPLGGSATRLADEGRGEPSLAGLRAAP